MMSTLSRFTDFFAALWETHRGRMVGVVVGLLIGIMFLTLGFFRTVFLLFLMGAGYMLGSHIDNNEDIMELLDRILPPGYHK